MNPPSEGLEFVCIALKAVAAAALGPAEEFLLLDFCVHDADSQRMKWCPLRALLGFVGASNLAGSSIDISFLRTNASFGQLSRWGVGKQPVLRNHENPRRRSAFFEPPFEIWPLCLGAWHCLLICTNRRLFPYDKRILRYPPPPHRSRIFSGTRRAKYFDISCAVFSLFTYYSCQDTAFLSRVLNQHVQAKE